MNVPPHILIENNSTTVENQYSTLIYSGDQHKANLGSDICFTSDTVIMNCRNNLSNDSVGICLTGKFPNEARGLRIALNSGNSRYVGGEFVTDCRQGTNNGLLLFGQLVINYSTGVMVVHSRILTAESNITALEGRMNTAESNSDKHSKYSNQYIKHSNQYIKHSAKRI